MARGETNADLDEAWLYQVCDKRNIKPTLEQAEAFIERVAILMCDANFEEHRARTMALDEVLK
jgi:hypothetical protein